MNESEVRRARRCGFESVARRVLVKALWQHVFRV
jgi:hypothetical protein